MQLDGINGLLIQTSLKGVCDSKECLCGNVSKGYAVQGSSKF